MCVCVSVRVSIHVSVPDFVLDFLLNSSNLYRGQVGQRLLYIGVRVDDVYSVVQLGQNRFGPSSLRALHGTKCPLLIFKIQFKSDFLLMSTLRQKMWMFNFLHSKFTRSAGELGFTR